MPIEPNHNADELLKSYARKRRQQVGDAPCRMSQVTRNLLHAEVARQAQAVSSSSRPEDGLLRGLWLRIILAGGCVAVVCLGLGLWVHSQHQDEVALAQNTAPFFHDDSVDAPPKSRAPEPGVLNERLQGFENRPRPEKLAQTGPQAQSGEKQPDLEQLSRRNLTRAEAQEQRVEVAMSAPPTAAPSDSDLLSNGPKFSFGLAGPPAQSAASSDKDTADEARRAGRSVALKQEDAALLKGTLDTAAAPAPPKPSVLAAGENAQSTIKADDNLPAAGPRSAAIQTSEPGEPTQSKVAAKTVQLANRQSAVAAGAPEAANQALRFQQVDLSSRYRRNLNSPPPPDVLRTFQVQVSGQNVRIVDADGSVYEGPISAASNLSASIQSGVTLRLAERGLATPALAQAEQSKPDRDVAKAVTPVSGNTTFSYGAGNFAFRATGTNRTLNQVVVFTGNLGQPQIQSSGGGIGGAGGGGLGGGGQNASTQAAAPAMQPATMQRYGLATQVGLQGGTAPTIAPGQAPLSQNSVSAPLRIQGWASIGKNELTIDALQVGP